MERALKNALFVAGLAGLALTAGAQTAKPAKAEAATHSTVKKHRQKAAGDGGVHGKVNAGEAASLERTEAGQTSEDVREENRGRLTSARLQRHPSQVSSAVYHGPSHAAVQKMDVHQQNHTAQLKTGKLTNRQNAPLETKKTALHGVSHSSHGPNPKLPARVAPIPPDQSSPEIHLKKHNARMF